jgi:hypothetical protein
MQNYIIITIIIAIILILIYKNNIKNTKYIKNVEQFNDFEVYSEDSLNTLNNLYNAYQNRNNTTNFNKLITNNIIAESLNTHSIIKVNKAGSADFGTGDVLRYSTRDNMNSWINSPPVYPQWVNMTIIGTPKPISQSPHMNLLNRDNYTLGDKSDVLINKDTEKDSVLDINTATNVNRNDIFSFEVKVDGSSNKYYSFYGPFNDKTNRTGLRYDPTLSYIVGFDPNKLYKIDCTVIFYGTIPYNTWCNLHLYISNINDEKYASTKCAAYYISTHILRVGCIRSNIEATGIKLMIYNINNTPGKDITFWKWNDVNISHPHPAANISINIEEIRRGL